MFNLDKLEAPTPISTFVAQSQIVILSCLCVCLAAVMVGFESFKQNHAESDNRLSSVFVPVVIVILCLIGNYTIDIYSLLLGVKIPKLFIIKYIQYYIFTKIKYFLHFILGFCMLCIVLQPNSQQPLNFKVPFVPLLPTLSVFINSYLMLKLSNITWIRFTVWMAIGFLVYGCYGWRNSSEEYRDAGKTPPNELKK